METRQRLRPWLEAKVDSGTIKGLQWLNNEKTMFRIPWKHGGKQDWTPDSSRIFMEWAKHTGRYREGIDEVDYATWKTRLRCAFNKAPDIQEVKDMTNLDAPEPFRVYLLLPKADVRSPAGSPASDTDYSASQAHTPGAHGGDMEHRDASWDDLGQYIHNSTERCSGSLPWDLVTLDASDLLTSKLPSHGNQMSDYTDYMQLCEMLTDSGDHVSWHSLGAFMGHEIHLTVYYGKIIVYDEPISNPNGIRLFYGDLPPVKPSNMAPGSFEKLYGPDGLQQITLPPPDKLVYSEIQRRALSKVLENMTRGLLVSCKDGDIIAKRLCKCAVFCSSTQTNGQAIKLERDQQRKIFGFEMFTNQLQSYETGQMVVPPSREVFLAFGQQWQFTEGQENAVVSAKIRSRKAQEQYASSTTATSVLISESNELDDMVKNLQIKN